MNYFHNFSPKILNYLYNLDLFLYLKTGSFARPPF